MRIFIGLLLLTGVAFWARPAAARPRDDAMAGAYRCAGISDSRQWLDCYYGAAQPVRAALGLAPALPGQVKLALAPPAGGAPRDEDLRDDVTAGAAACTRSPSDRAWLDCYYEAAIVMRVQLGLPHPAGWDAPRRASVPPASPASRSGLPPMPRSTGLLAGLLGATRPVVHKVPMETFTLDRRGAFTVTLADGQVWEQAAEDEVYHPARWGNAGPDTLVTITPEAMHTFTMMVEGQQRIYKVKRIR